jgi:hypothetical protein
MSESSAGSAGSGQSEDETQAIVIPASHYNAAVDALDRLFEADRREGGGNGDTNGDKEALVINCTTGHFTPASSAHHGHRDFSCDQVD